MQKVRSPVAKLPQVSGWFYVRVPFDRTTIYYSAGCHLHLLILLYDLAARAYFSILVFLDYCHKLPPLQSGTDSH